MKIFIRSLALFSLLLLIGGAALAQGTSGNLIGTVTASGSGLPGVSVTLSSPSLQGTRTTVTSEGGAYSFAGLTPGDYTVQFELSGMQNVTKKTRVNLSQTSRADADLKPTAISEAITVTATAPAALETTEVSTNFTSDTIAELPTLNRTIATAALLSPGVNDGGPNNQIVISGAQSFDNLFLVNGVVVNENLRGQPQPLFIEDAVQETTVISGGAISAEYGRFTGGVVSTITKSGGNDFSGSLRDSLRNDTWKDKTGFPGEADHFDDISSVYEGTLGGRILTDRLWFFVAGRKEKTSLSQETVETRIPYANLTDQKRYEVKLTGQITPKHNLAVSYLEVKTTNPGNVFGNVVDLRSLATLERDNKLKGLHYNGILSDNLLLEGQYSEMENVFSSGATTNDRIEGTLLRETGTSFRAWSPTFCGICRPKERNNKSSLVKGSYFLPTKGMGQHSFVAGWEDFHQLRIEDNYQSGSNYRLWGDFDFNSSGGLIFRANPANGLVGYQPLLEASKGSDFLVRSLFANDKWDVNNHFNVNLGVRYDKASGKNQSKVKTVDDTAISPRLGLGFDLRGDGVHRFTASYAKYASKVDQGPADATSFGGRYASYYWDYRGPAINPAGTPASQIVPVAEVIRQMFAWFDSQGGVNNTSLINSLSFPGYTSRIGDNLTAPSMDEYSIGYGTQLGARGYVRADVIRREWNDFYILRKDLSTGKVRLPAPSTASVDQGVIETGNADLERNYTGIQTQANYRFNDRLSIGGNYTWSKLRGNIEGEQYNNATVLAGCNGGAAVPGTDTGLCAPEYQAFAQNHPVGYLEADMRHRLSVWAQYNLITDLGRFNFSVLEKYHSGLPYSAAAGIDVRFNATTLPDGVVNPGYVTPPSRVWYYFSDRGQFRVDDITSTNIAVNYESPAIGHVRFFVQTDIVNVFNESKVEYPSTSRGPVINTTVNVRRTTPSLTAFNPFKTTPVLGTHYTLPATFGRPTNREAYQDPREYRISFGVRF